VACAERLTGQDLARIYSEVTGEKSRFETMSEETFKQHFPNVDQGKELYEMFQYYDQFGLFSDEFDLEQGKTIYPLTSFRELLTRTQYRQGQTDSRFAP